MEQRIEKAVKKKLEAYRPTVDVSRVGGNWHAIWTVLNGLVIE